MAITGIVVHERDYRVPAWKDTLATVIAAALVGWAMVPIYILRLVTKL
jgi:hypothetical protein